MLEVTFGDNPYHGDAREGISNVLLNTAMLVLSVIRKFRIQCINELWFLSGFYQRAEDSRASRKVLQT